MPRTSTVDCCDAVKPQLSLPDQLLASLCRDPNPMLANVERHEVVGFVYLIEPEGDQRVCKVGSAEFVGLRLSQLQCGAWDTLRCAGAVGFRSGNHVLAEFATHRALTAAGHHRRGEWFNLSGIEAIDWVIHVARERGDEIVDVASLEAAVRAGHQTFLINDEIERRAKLRRKLSMD